MNAWSDGDVVHFDATISAGNPFTFFKDSEGQFTDPGLGVGQITRLSFDLSDQNDHVEIRKIAGAIGEMPRCDERFQMSACRYGYGKSRDGVMRVDWATGAVQQHLTPDGATQEPVFVPRSADAAEGDGWLLCLTTRPTENRADLLVIDSMNMDGPPVATVRLPFNQPMAFHGMFAPSVRGPNSLE